MFEIFVKSERDTYIVFLLGGRCVTVTARLTTVTTVTASPAASTLPATQHTVITNTNTGFTAFKQIKKKIVLRFSKII